MDIQTRIRKNRQSCPDFGTEYSARRSARKDVKSLIDQFEFIADKSKKNDILKKYSSCTYNRVFDTGAMSREERRKFSESDSVFLDRNSVEKLLKTCHNRNQSSIVAGQSAGKHVLSKSAVTNNSRNDEKPRRNDILDLFGRKKNDQQFTRSVSTQNSDRTKIMQRNISTTSLNEDEQRKLNKSSQIRLGSPSYVRAKIQCFEPQETDSTDNILRRPPTKSNGTVCQSNDASLFRKRTNSYILATQSESNLKIYSVDEPTVENVQIRNSYQSSSSSDKHRKFKLYPPPSPKPEHLKSRKTQIVQNKQEVKSSKNIFEQIKTVSDPADGKKRSTYVSQAVSKFEKDPHNPILAVVDLQDPKEKDHLKDQINNIFSKRRATGSSNKEITKQINDILLERHKYSTVQKEPYNGSRTLKNVCNGESEKEDINKQNILSNSSNTEENNISVKCKGDENNILLVIDNQNERKHFKNEIGAESLEDKHKENVINIGQWERQITPSENCEETISKEITATSNKDSIEQCSNDKEGDKSEANGFDEEKIITLVYHHTENENSANITVSSNNQANSSENYTLDTVTLIQIAATDENETNATITSDNIIGTDISGNVEIQEIDLKSSAEYTVETPNTKPDYVIIMRDSATINSNESSSSQAENETQNKPESPQIHNVSEAVNTNVKSVHLSTNDSEWSLDKLSTKSMKMKLWSLNSNEDMTRNEISDEESKCYSVRTNEIDDSESVTTPDKSIECCGEFTVPTFESQKSVDEINTSVEELLAHVDNVRQSIPINTQRVSRLYSAKFGTGSPVSADVQKPDSDNNNNNTKTRKNKSEPKEDDKILLENIERLSDKNDDDDELSTANEAMNFVLDFCEEVKKDPQFVEVYNPSPRMSKERFINEWVQNVNQDYSVCGTESRTESQAEESNDDESILSGISTTSEDQVFQSFEYSLSAEGQESWTYRDDQDNPVFVEQSTLKPYNSEAVELRSPSRTVGQKIEESESEYRRSIENIKNNSRRKGLMEEIISTERRYVERSLRLLVEEYMPEMDRSGLPVGLVGRGGQIFGNVNLLYQAHLQFLPALEACQDTDQIADCFLKHDSLFKLYPLYAKNKPVSDSVMKDYGSYFIKKQKELRDPLDLPSYLLTPIQRLGKYCLLMKSLTRECEKENICNEKVKKATEMLQKQMSLGNNLIATDSIVGCPVSLREQGDLLLRDTFTVCSPTKKLPFEAMIFLFKESLIITSIQRQNASEQFLFREIFKLTDMGYTRNSNENLTFQVWFRKMNQKTHSLKAKKPSIKDKWIKEIHTLLMQQLEANRSRKKKEQEELGLKASVQPVSPRPISIPNSKRHKSSPKNGRAQSSPVWYTPEN